MPDPREAAEAYADAASRGDADAIYGMMASRSRAVITRDELATKVADQRQELKDLAKAIASPATEVKAEAQVPYGDGEHAALVVEDGEFKVAGADALPAAARTPTQALEALRRVLARRSYAGLLRVLSKRTREAIEADMRSLVEGLERPEGLDVHVTGDLAVVEVPGGHIVRMRREGGAWHVEDFE
jgi:hypothetical protein